MTQEEAEAFVKAVYPESVVEPAELSTDWWRIWAEKAGPVPRLLGHGSTVAKAWVHAAERMAMRVAGGCPE